MDVAGSKRETSDTRVKRGYAFFFLVYTPAVLLANREVGVVVGIAVLIGLFVVPFVLVFRGSRTPGHSSYQDGRVVYRGERRPGTLLYKATALTASGLLLAALLGGAWVDPEWFQLFPWAIKAGFLAIGLYLLSPTLPVTHVALAIEGDLLRYQSRKAPWYSTAYRAPSEVPLDRITKVRMDYFAGYRSESALHLVLEGPESLPGLNMALGEIWIDPALGGAVTAFLEELRRRRPAIELEGDLRPKWMR